MPGEVPSHVRPAAFGRFRVLHQIGAGSVGPLFRGEDPDTHAAVAIKQLRLNLSPERARLVRDELLALVERLPDHPGLPRVIDAGLYEIDPYVVTTWSAGESLDVALREYGPAAIADALPRLRGLADALDCAALAGVWHGSLQPRDIVVSAEQTRLVGLGITPALERAGVRPPALRPYTAPEVIRGEPSSPVSDQYALAVVAHEWLFGGLIGAAEAPLDLPPLPGVRVDGLTDALTSALAPRPASRFASCVAFVEAMEAAVIDGAHVPVARPARALPSRVPLTTTLPLEDDDPAGAAGLLGDEQVVDGAPTELAIDLHFDSELPSPTSEHKPPATRLSATPRGAGTVAWRGSFAGAPEGGDEDAPRHRSPSLALLAALVAGIAIGAAGGYAVATARLMQSAPALSASAPDTSAAVEAPPGRDFTDASIVRPHQETAEEPPAAAALPPGMSRTPPPPNAAGDSAVVAASRRDTAQLLVRSTPGGATVTIDGTARGSTPVALRELALGTRTVVINRPGYIPVERRITLTADRPSRSIEVALASVAAASGTAPPSLRGRPGRPEQGPQPGNPPAAVATAAGSLVVDSRPVGATVTVDGQASGETPLMLRTVTPGLHTVRIERVGYRPWTTTVEVKAGERMRVAASLVGDGAHE